MREQREAYLRAAEAQDEAAHAHQLRQAELESHGEHQEHHAELGEVFRALGVGDQPERMGTEDRAYEEVTEDRRDVQPAKDRDDDDRGGEKDER